MSTREGRSYLDRKVKFMSKIDELLRDYSRVFVVGADNVGSKQLQQIRVAIRGNGVLLMGKNTMIRNALTKAIQTNPALKALKDLVVENIGLVFTKAAIPKVKELLLSNRVPAQAKVGAIAPQDVKVPAGGTGLDPGQTSFFQALNISTKLTRGEIEILNDYVVCKSGEVVNASVAALLQKLKITPFTYGLEIRCVYDSGTVFEPAVLDISDEQIAASFLQGVGNVAALSLQIGYPTLASLPHIIVNAYKNVLAVGLQTKYSFPAADKVKNAIANPVAAPKSSAEVKPEKAAPPKEEKKKEPEKTKAKEPEPAADDEGGIGDLFGF